MPPVRVRVRVRALSVHAGYRCGNSGACCSSGWEIPVEPAVEDGLRAALRTGRLRLPAFGARALRGGSPPAEAFRPVSGLAHGARVVLEHVEAGRCVFLELDPAGGRAVGGSRPTARCAVHDQLGEEALASACRQFPRVVTLTPLGVSVTLSHYCPTAAAMLFRSPEGGVPAAPASHPEGGFAPTLASHPEGGFAPTLASHPEGGCAAAPEGSAVPPLRILESPPGFPPTWPYEGLDARFALPPFLRPGVLMSWPALERWEDHAVATLADESLSPEAALDALAAAAERARAWTPAHGPFDAFFIEALSSRGAPVVAADEGFGVTSWELGARSVPAGHPLPPSPRSAIGRAGPDRVAALVDEGWTALHRPIRAWLAGKAFASWLVLQGDGLRSAALGLRLALGVLRAEAARGCVEAGTGLDAGLLKESLRRADRLFFHLADPESLARGLSRCE